nr:uncharacterized protein LOC111839105 [Paramormyrops kingsleyae]
MIPFRSTIHVICISMKVPEFKSDIQNTVSSLSLLNAFSGHVEPQQQTEEFKHLTQTKFQEIRKGLAECISRWSENHVHLKDWRPIFDLPLPDHWQQMWVETLKELFMKRVRQMKPLQQVQLCRKNLSEIPVLDDCLLKCATTAIRDLVNETTAHSPMDYLEEVSRCKKLMSVTVMEILGPLQSNNKDWLYLLSNSQCRNLLIVLNKCQKEDSCYNEKLDQAKKLIEIAEKEMKTLLIHIKKNSVASKVVYHILKDNDADKLCQLFVEKNEENNFKKALESARKDLNFLEQQQKQIKGLIFLCDHIAAILTVDVSYLRQCQNIDFSKEEHSLCFF